MEQKDRYDALMTLTVLESALLCIMDVATDAIDTISVERQALIQSGCKARREEGENDRDKPGTQTANA